jgi:hypothetical protein
VAVPLQDLAHRRPQPYVILDEQDPAHKASSRLRPFGAKSAESGRSIGRIGAKSAESDAVTRFGSPPAAASIPGQIACKIASMLSTVGPQPSTADQRNLSPRGVHSPRTGTLPLQIGFRRELK